MVSDAIQNPSVTARQGKRAKRTFGQIVWTALAWLFTLVTIAALLVGWSLREVRLVNPEVGIGYWLGIAGGGMMMFLVFYSLRKRVGWMRRAFSVPTWFRLHIVLGVVGPVLVLYHANFSTGSFNATFALYSMLVVAVSGLIGRYVYNRVHRSLDGHHLSLAELRNESDSTRKQLALLLAHAPQVADELARFEIRATAPTHSMFASFARSLWLSFVAPWQYRSMRRRLLAALNQRARRDDWPKAQLRNARRAGNRALSAHLNAVRRVSDLRFFERLFSLWHLLHLPLYVMLIITGWVHVYAVHVY
jgi:hypothetical protein